jgi:hypothetical protein
MAMFVSAAARPAVYASAPNRFDISAAREVARILVDNWLKTRRSAVRISKSDQRIEHAECDWPALRMERLLLKPLACFRQSTPIRGQQGVLFATCATRRRDAHEETVSRVQKILDWLGPDFAGVIMFDERHALANTACARRSPPTGSGSSGITQILKATGLAWEIIAWTLRLFVPTAANAPVILAALMECFSFVRIADRAAA